MPREVACTCGQRFTIHADRSPAKVSCFMCGRKFTVPPAGTSDPALSTAIQAGLPAAPASAITCWRAPPTRHEVDDEASSRLAEELRQIENDWRVERLKYPGVESRLAQIGTVSSAIVASLVGGVGVASVVVAPQLLWLLGLEAAGFCVQAGRESEELREYEEAEEAYRRRRTAAIARHCGSAASVNSSESVRRSV
jgi:hypothetical protein